MNPEKRPFRYADNKMMEELENRQNELKETAMGLNLSILSLTRDLNGEYSDEGLKKLISEMVRDFMLSYDRHSYPEGYDLPDGWRLFDPMDVDLYITWLYVVIRTAQSGLKYIRSPRELVMIDGEEAEDFCSGISVVNQDSFRTILKNIRMTHTHEDGTETYTTSQIVTWSLRMTAETLYEFLTEGTRMRFPDPCERLDDYLIADYGSVEEGRRRLEEESRNRMIVRDIPAVFISPVFEGYEDLARTDEETMEDIREYEQYQYDRRNDPDISEESYERNKCLLCQLDPDHNDDDRRAFELEGKRIRRNFMSAQEYISQYEHLVEIMDHEYCTCNGRENYFDHRKRDFKLCMRWMIEDYLKNHGLTVYADQDTCAEALACIGRASDLIRKAQNGNGYVSDQG